MISILSSLIKEKFEAHKFKYWNTRFSKMSPDQIGFAASEFEAGFNAAMSTEVTPVWHELSIEGESEPKLFKTAQAAEEYRVTRISDGTSVQIRPLFANAQLVNGQKPPQALLESMAKRHRHDFTTLKYSDRQLILMRMRQLFDEVAGYGFYTAPEITYPEPDYYGTEDEEGGKTLDDLANLMSSHREDGDLVTVYESVTLNVRDYRLTGLEDGNPALELVEPGENKAKLLESTV